MLHFYTLLAGFALKYCKNADYYRLAPLEMLNTVESSIQHGYMEILASYTAA